VLLHLEARALCQHSTEMGCGASTSAQAQGDAPRGEGDKSEEEQAAAHGPDLSDVPAAGEAGSAGCSITYPRFMGKKKELRSKGFRGRVRMICVALNYEGTDSPLGCWRDSERLSQIASKAGCKDITKLYDNGEHALFPSKAGVTEAIRDVGQRCGEHDYLVFCYSGHGASEENANAPSGRDCMLCLRTPDGEDERMVDHEIASLIASCVPPSVRLLVLVDACHSGGILDMDTPGLWSGRRVCCISGCTENQLSTDSGDGGVMTNALLKVLERRKVRARRKRRELSVQFIFNRMVVEMPEDEEEEGEDQDVDEEWDDEDDWDDSEDEEEDDEDEEEEDDHEPGQDLTLSWPADQDPSKITWPF